MIKRIFYISIFASLCLTSCQESLQDKAAREAREYTEKYCPTPEQGNLITDSVVFDQNTSTYIYYHTLTGTADDYEQANSKKEEVRQHLLNQIKSQSSSVNYIEAGFSYRFIYRSQKNPKKVLLEYLFATKDLK